MSVKKIGFLGFVFSIFLNIIIWGYFPKISVLSWTHYALWGLALAGLIVWIVFSLEQLRGFFKLRSSQFGLGLTITAVMVVGILSVVNWAAFKYNKKWDLTKNKLYSLSDQSEKIVKELKEKVVIRVWTTNIESMGGNTDLKRFLDNYAIKSGGKVAVEIKNPNDHVEESTRDQVKKANMIIVRSESGRENRIEVFNDAKSEELITNAIIQTQKGGKKMVCFLAGHGELSINNNQADGLSFAKERLNASSYETQEIILATAEKFPTDCEMLVIPGPMSAPTEKETTWLSEYLAKGGKIFALFGPGTHATWNTLLKPYGVEAQKDVVLDLRQRPASLVVTKNYADDVDITKAFEPNLVLPETSSLKVPTSTTFDGAQIRPFISSESWTYAKAGLLTEIRDAAKRSGDKSGPLPIAALITKPVANDNGTPPAPTPEKTDAETDENADSNKKETTLIVTTNHKFAANAFVSLLGNLDYFLNTVSFLAKDKELIGIRPRENTKVNLQLTNESPKQVIATVLLLAVVFAVGFFWSLTRKISTST